jgi:hypothetical protein
MLKPPDNMYCFQTKSKTCFNENKALIIKHILNRRIKIRANVSMGSDSIDLYELVQQGLIEEVVLGNGNLLYKLPEGKDKWL